MRSVLCLVIGAAMIAAADDKLSGPPESFNDLRKVYDKARPPIPGDISGLWSGYCVRAHPKPYDRSAFKEMQLLSVDERSRRFIRVPMTDVSEGSGWTQSPFDPGFRLDADGEADLRSAVRSSLAYHRPWRPEKGGLCGELAYPGEPPQQDSLRQTGGTLLIRHDLLRPWDRTRRRETYSYCYFAARLKD